MLAAIRAVRRWKAWDEIGVMLQDSVGHCISNIYSSLERNQMGQLASRM